MADTGEDREIKERTDAREGARSCRKRRSYCRNQRQRETVPWTKAAVEPNHEARRSSGSGPESHSCR